MIMHKERFSFDRKAVFIAVSLLLVSASSIAVAGHQDNSNQIIVTYSFEQPILEKIRIENTMYDDVVLPGVISAGNPGEPCLPIKGAYVLLPQGTTVNKITVTTSEKICLGDDFVVKPVGDIVPLSKRNSVSLPIPDEKIYSSSSEFPGDLFTEVGIYCFRGYQILVLDLYPVQYIPAHGELFCYREMTVSLSLRDKGINPLYRGFEEDKIEVINKVGNSNTVKTYTQPDIHPVDSYDLLILTTDGLKDGFELLKNAHNYEGITTVIKTLSDVGGSTPEDIRDYIRDAYMDWGIDYVLLGGDDGVVPAKTLWVFGLDEETTPYETYMPSDLYYGCLDGTYNYDGDNKWGEPTDGEGGGDVDIVAEVYVGRACVGNTDEVDNFVSKTISYMYSNDDYLENVLMAGEYLGDYGVASFGGNYLDQLINGSDLDGYVTVGIPWDEYTIEKLYDRDWPGFDPDDPWDTGWPKSEIIDRINNGVHIISHDGHSNYDYNLKMSNADVDALVNDKYCFVYSVGCMAGGFDNDDCIAEHFTIKTEHGAYAVIMNARYGWFWSYSTDGDSTRYTREFWDAVFGEDMPVISMANQDSKEDNLYLIDRSCMRWCYYQLNLFGDPTLGFWKDLTPRPRLSIGNITGGFGATAIIKNIGDADATDVEWTITVTGGLLGLINKEASGTGTIPVGDEIFAEIGIIFGLGTIKITITVECAEGSFAEATADGTQILFFTKIWNGGESHLFI